MAGTSIESHTFYQESLSTLYNVEVGLFVDSAMMRCPVGNYSAPDPSSLDLRHDPIPIRQASRGHISESRILCLPRSAGREEAHVRHDVVAQSKLCRRDVSVAGRSKSQVTWGHSTRHAARKRSLTVLT
jgi:hypothetical protein